jgi:hypothetical protein
MESRFGADFSNVKIHTGNEPEQLNRSLNAKAFTVSNNIYFNTGQYQPETDGGKHLLAHELTHVVQQGNAVQRKIIQRKVNPDEGRIYTDEGLKYENAIRQNLDNWQLLYKFYNIFLK